MQGDLGSLSLSSCLHWGCGRPGSSDRQGLWAAGLPALPCLQAPGSLSLGPARPDVTVPCLTATSTSVLPFPPFKAEFKPLLIMRECFWIHVFIWQTLPEPWSSGWGHSDELHSALPACPSEPGRDAEKSTSAC